MNKLAQYLSDQNIRQSDFAVLCETTQGTVSRLVNGSMQPSPSIAKKIEGITDGSVKFYDWKVYAAFTPD
jgi:transcriptional regulator with XRE-family HTH domain